MQQQQQMQQQQIDDINNNNSASATTPEANPADAVQSVADAVTSVNGENQQQQQTTDSQSGSSSTTTTNINGAPGMTIRMTPANLNEDQKAFVVSKIKEMAPMYRSINNWIDILSTFGSEKEQDMVKKLQGCVLFFLIRVG
jgi:hypothetical protein